MATTRGKKRKRREFEKSVGPVVHTISPYLTASDMGHVSSISLFSRVYQNPKDFIWRNLYITHYGPLYFQGDYQNQYIAETLFSHAKTQAQARVDVLTPTAEEKALDDHIKAQANINKPWTLIYQAYLTSLTPNHLQTVKCAMDALGFGDCRGAEFLTHYFYEMNLLTDDDVSLIQAFLKLMQEKDSDRHILAKQISLVYALEYNATFRANVNADELKKSALQYLVFAVQYNAMDTRSFFSFFLTVFEKLHLHLDDELMERVKNEITTQASNPLQVFEIVLNKKISLNAKNAICFMLEKLAELKVFGARYILGEHFNKLALLEKIFHKNKDDSFSQHAREHFLQAFDDNDLRAITGLRILMDGAESKELGDDKWNAILQKGLNGGDSNSFFIKANETCKFKWSNNLERIWIMQIAATKQEPSNRYFNMLQRQAEHPDHGLYVHCALTLVYALRNNNLKEALSEMRLVISVNADAYQTYLAEGKRLGYCTKQHEQSIKNLFTTIEEKHPQLTNTQPNQPQR